MKIAVKFLVSLGVALLIAWAVRTYVFTVFSVPAGGLPPKLKEGNRVIVNRIDCDVFARGETVVFSDSVDCPSPPGSSSSGSAASSSSKSPGESSPEVFFVGMIEKLPGDTIQLDSNSYIIPTICCKRCGCKDCRYYLVRTASGVQLVHKHQMIGKAYKIF